MIVVALMASPAVGATTDYAQLATKNILPWLESRGQLFGLQPQAADSLQWSDEYTTSCTETDYYRMLNIVSNPTSYYCPTGYYRLRSTRGGYLFTTRKGDYADLLFHYFNRAFLLYSGMGKGNTTYYRTNLSTISNLYFW